MEQLEQGFPRRFRQHRRFDGHPPEVAVRFPGNPAPLGVGLFGKRAAELMVDEATPNREGKVSESSDERTNRAAGAEWKQ
jgi:hypothetical protein